MTTRSGALQQVIEFLEHRHWTRAREAERFLVYQPPPGRKRDPYELYIPRDPASPDFSRALDLALEAIASYYGSPLESIEALLLQSAEVVSLRLDGEGYCGGAARLPRFEGMMEHLKRAISGTVGFIVTDDPVAPPPQGAAQAFLNDCWFLQTMRGSFVARVALPTSGDLSTARQPELWHKPRPRVLVSETLRGVSELVGERVLEDDRSLYTEAGYDAVRQSVSVTVLQEMAHLFRSTKAANVEMTFDRRGDARRVPLRQLTKERLHRLDAFVEFAREQANLTFPLQASGHVFLWRGPRRETRRVTSTLAGITALVDGRLMDVTFRVEPQALGLVTEAVRSNRVLYVSGRARRMRTQLRLEPPLAIDLGEQVPRA